ncbi:GNAT family N-acetyltransferase [Natronomonas sp. EA1]|uniref:GNAT family N-acetyltransferase n=1 Tax=Natronomonas sp. EA1 TaxID=3421655 RepID=UPI003EBB3941
MPGPVFLDGDRVTLRPATEADTSFLLREWNNPAVRASRSDLYPRDRGDLEAYLGGRFGRESRSLALLICHNGDAVGLAILSREQPNDVSFRRGELAFWVAREEWDNGYATAGSRLLLSHAFGRLGLHKVTAAAFESNGGSLRVLEKLGFTEEGRHREEALNGGEWEDFVRFGLLEDEWFGRE